MTLFDADEDALLSNEHAVSLFVGMISFFWGIASFAIMKMIDINPMVSATMMVCGLMLCVTGVYNTASIIAKINDALLFHFYGKMKLALKNKGEPIKYLLPLCIGIFILSFSMLISTRDVNEIFTTSFVLCAVLPILIMFGRMYSRLAMYKRAFLFE